MPQYSISRYGNLFYFRFKRQNPIFIGKKYFDIEIHIWKIFSFSAGYGLFWFKIFNRYGVWAKNIKSNHLLFSQREKYSKFEYHKLGNWVFQFFKK